MTLNYVFRYDKNNKINNIKPYRLDTVIHVCKPSTLGVVDVEAKGSGDQGLPLLLVSQRLV